MKNIQKEIRRKIEELADEEYRVFQSKLCPGIDNIIGVRIPVLRRLAKQTLREDFLRYLQGTQEEYYEEIMLKGMIIGLADMDWEDKKEAIISFVPKINNWAICDIFCSGLKVSKEYQNQMLEVIQSYLNSDKEFEIRFAIVMLLNYYITQESIKDVLIYIEQLSYEKYKDYYYVKMAIAWLISCAYIKFPEISNAFLNKTQIEDFTYNKAISKILESYRVSDIEKERIRLLKR